VEINLVFFFFLNFFQFCNVANNPQEHLAKFGYIPKVEKYKNPFIFWLLDAT
jgi:hypothetical protein